MSIDNTTLLSLNMDLNDPIALRNTLLLMIQQLDLIIGNRVVDVTYTYIKVAPSAGYTQSEAVQVADDLETLYNKVADLEARLVPVNN